MYNQLIKGVAKLLNKSLIISLLVIPCSLSVMGQALSPKDSIRFKKDFEALLLKYHIKNKGYTINVQSMNQKGGQTAFIINNNNYYGDSVLSSENFGFTIDTTDGKYAIAVYPKKGIWVNPYIGIDTSDYFGGTVSYSTGVGVGTNISGITFKLDSTTHDLVFLIREGSCSRNVPMIVRVSKSKKNYFFTFGDYADDNKSYLMQNGKATALSPRPPMPIGN
jgi:hypothetical protein